MTAQFSDTVLYKNNIYDIAGIDGKGLFDPSEHHMKPSSRCSACWNGFLCAYLVNNGKLFLNNLKISLTASNSRNRISAHTIRNISPVHIGGESFVGFEYKYENMNYNQNFTGGLLLARGFIEELYVHMGFHPAWKYQHVYELIFEEGNLTKELDLSGKMQDIRTKVTNTNNTTGNDASSLENPLQWIEKCFSRNYHF